MKRIYSAAVFCLIILITGCVSEYEEPYEDYAEPDFNWPTLDPDRYHWDGFANPFYEFWSYRVTDPDTGKSFSFIYGIINPVAEQGQPSEGFLYVRADDGDFLYAPVPYSRFEASIGRCDVKIATSRATESHISGAILHRNGDISWNLSIEILSKWSKTMGSLTNIPALPVNWYVNGLNARATGEINWRGKKYYINNGVAFNDHSWGEVFPKAWLFAQSNSFFNENEAVAFAGGVVDFLVTEKPAYMLAYKTQERLYEFQSQDLNVVFYTEIDLETGRLVVTAIKGSKKIVLTIDAEVEGMMNVLVPRYEGMIPGSKQAMSGAFIVELYNRNDQNMLWEIERRSTSVNGAVGFGGQYGGFDFY